MAEADKFFVRPKRLDVDISIFGTAEAAKVYKHWKRTVENYIAECEAAIPAESKRTLNKLNIVVGNVSADIFQLIEDCTTYKDAMAILQNTFVKQPNEVYARHMLTIRKQKPSETLADFYRALLSMSKDCQFKAVSAELYRDEMCRDSFIAGMTSSAIRQRLLEEKQLTLQQAFDIAIAREDANKQNQDYSSTPSSVVAATNNTKRQPIAHETSDVTAALQNRPEPNVKRCDDCGYPRYQPHKCRAKGRNFKNGRLW